MPIKKLLKYLKKIEINETLAVGIIIIVLIIPSSMFLEKERIIKEIKTISPGAVFIPGDSTKIEKKSDSLIIRNNIITISTTTTSIEDYNIKFVREIGKSGFNVSSKLFLYKNKDLVFETNKEKDFGDFLSADDSVGDWIKNANDIKRRAVKDITGNGIPELVLFGYSGGAHCCFQDYVIELSTPISVLLNLSSEDSAVDLVDLNNDGIPELETRDSVFAYWHTGYASSLLPRVVLSLQDGKYKADPIFMRKITPSISEIQNMVDKVNTWSGTDNPIPWNYAIKLIYEGNIVSARKYIDLVWNNNINVEFATKDIFWKELEKQIKKSVYYNDLSSYFGI